MIHIVRPSNEMSSSRKQLAAAHDGNVVRLPEKNLWVLSSLPRAPTSARNNLPSPG
ncbi:hypothetical protein GQ55_3G110400 [Panicum hallii var. hallii]|uniref:Uncharacterized protein n=1 Tax=Panicum hallii var. hallii TaxID=1504633 RepID=A0A2T7E854_9POAL|nr:hypothetical protein GQ55_3G110400 [Panicum hallii var. hallii]